jgi:cobalt-zinc-cadmium efflux system protein
MSHDHSHHTSSKKLGLTIVLNLGITTAQVIGGILSGSIALLTDAAHNFSDVISLVVSYTANRLAKKRATSDKTFGYKRAEIIAAFINSISLILLSLWLIIESIQRLLDPQPVEEKTVILLSLIAIAGNGLSVFLLHKQTENNINLKSAYIHLLSDLMASVIVLVGGIAIYYFDVYWVDPLLGILISIYLIYIGYDLLKESIQILMLYTPVEISLDEVVSTVEKLHPKTRLHHIHIWKLNDTEIHLEAHLDLKENLSLLEFQELQIQIEQLLWQQFKINHVTIQPEYNRSDEKDLIVQD